MVFYMRIVILIYFDGVIFNGHIIEYYNLLVVYIRSKTVTFTRVLLTFTLDR